MCVWEGGAWKAISIGYFWVLVGGSSEFESSFVGGGNRPA